MDFPMTYTYDMKTLAVLAAILTLMWVLIYPTSARAAYELPKFAPGTLDARSTRVAPDTGTAFPKFATPPTKRERIAELKRQIRALQKRIDELSV